MLGLPSAPSVRGFAPPSLIVQGGAFCVAAAHAQWALAVHVSLAAMVLGATATVAAAANAHVPDVQPSMPQVSPVPGALSRLRLPRVSRRRLWMWALLVGVFWAHFAELWEHARDEAAKVAVLFTSGRSAGKSRRAPAPVAGMFDFLAFGKAGAKHILLNDRGKANYYKTEIENGNMNFEAVAREFSTCPSGAKGGDLGTFGRGQMVAAFENYCFDPDTKVGDLGVVSTQFGVHIIKLTKKP